MDSSIQSAGDLAMMQSSPPQQAAKLARDANIDKTAQNFEGMFMGQMLKPMFDTINVDPVFGGGNGEEVMRSFLVQEYGKIAAKGSHLGIADAVKAEMIKAQSVTQKNGEANAITQ